MVPLWAPCKSHGLKLALSALSLGLPLRRMGPVTDFWEESLRDLGRWGGVTSGSHVPSVILGKSLLWAQCLFCKLEIIINTYFGGLFVGP